MQILPQESGPTFVAKGGVAIGIRHIPGRRSAGSAIARRGQLQAFCGRRQRGVHCITLWLWQDVLKAQMCQQLPAKFSHSFSQVVPTQELAQSAVFDTFPCHINLGASTILVASLLQSALESLQWMFAHCLHELRA